MTRQTCAIHPVPRTYVLRRLPESMRALTLVLGIFGVALAARPATAQIAGALGRPLPSPDLPAGTVSVRVVAGSAASPVVGTEVTLLVNGAPRVARTDSAGRASFPGLPAGATAIAKVLDEDKVEHPSEAFEVPQSGGVRVMITTRPWQDSSGGAPFAGSGMPNPRRMSGEPRGERSDPAGTLTVRVTYDDLSDSPEGVPVALVGYAADDTTSYQVVSTDKSGRAQFPDLDRSGGTSYFAMAVVPRGGATDRLMSRPIVPDAQVGTRMVLSSEKRDSQAPAIDDFAPFDPQVATPAGKVRVAVKSDREVTARVALVDAATRKVIGEAAPVVSPPYPPRVRTESRFVPSSKLAAGTLDVLVVGGPGQAEEPLKDVEVRVIPATSTDLTGGAASVTDASGLVRMTVQAGEPQKAVVMVQGQPLASKPFDITRSGGQLLFGAQWDPEVMIDAPGAQGRVVYAECELQHQRYRSMPFQLLETAGSTVTLYAFPRIQLQFQLEAEVEDELLAVRGRFEIANYSWAPYRAGPDGLVVALPRGFKGAVVAESDQSTVSVATGEGLRIVRPIPPLGTRFHAGFSLPVDSGTVQWHLDLPMGTSSSQFAVQQLPGMKLHTPPGVQSETRPTDRGPYELVGPIHIDAGKAMEMSITGLPSPSAWRTWVPAVIAVLAAGVMLAGLAFALAARPPGRAAQPTGASAGAARDARRHKLLDELVELERSDANPRRREQLLDELERLWS